MGKREKGDSEKVCETFEVDKDGKEKIVKTCSTEPKEHASKEELENQNRILKYIIFVIAGIFIILAFSLYYNHSVKNFEWGGWDFDVMQEGSITFYHTSFPTTLEGQNINYHVYLRGDPRKTEERVELSNMINFREAIVRQNTTDINCEGKGVIAIANFDQIMRAFGTQIFNDKNATCDEQGRYTFFTIGQGDENKIEKFGPSCFNVTFKDCEVIPVTERIILEALSQSK